jgi:alpha-L-fucosidase 2
MHSSGHDGVALQVHAQIIAEGGSASASDQSIEVKGQMQPRWRAFRTSFLGGMPEDVGNEALPHASHKDFAQLRNRLSTALSPHRH